MQRMKLVTNPMRNNLDGKGQPQRVFGHAAPRSSRGEYGRRILKEFIRNGRVIQLHATNGWRSHRLFIPS